VSSLSTRYPSLIHRHRHCDNALYPEVSFYAQATAAINHVVGYRRKLVYRRTWKLGQAGGATGVVCRWHCKTGYGAKRFAVFVNLGFDDRATSDDPYIAVAITKVGGATATLNFHGGASQVASTDAPEQWFPQIQHSDCDAASSYTGTVTFNDDVRVISIMVFEEYNPTPDEDTTYFTEWEPGAGSPIYDNRQSQLLAGVGGLLRLNLGLRADWGQADGAARTRSSATYINLHDNTTTGTPTAATPGYSFVTTALNTYSATTVPILMCVYGSIGAGSGSVVLRSTAPADAATVTINGAAAWYTAAGALTVGTGQKYDLMFAGDGVNTVSVYAVSIYAIQ
jgi:hypothetical protein